MTRALSNVQTLIAHSFIRYATTYLLCWSTKRPWRNSVRYANIDWNGVNRILVVRLRSIGDTVLSTPSLIALRRFLPDAKIDLLLEDWVAPVLDGFAYVDEILTFGEAASKLVLAREIRRRRYDVVFNIHGGTTSTFFTFASGARNRVGYQNYRYSFLYTHRLTSPSEFWGRAKAHSAEQQLALLGSVGIPVEDRPKSELTVTPAAAASLEKKFRQAAGHELRDLGAFALFHPAAAFETKEWAPANFSAVADQLHQRGVKVVAVAAGAERPLLDAVRSLANSPLQVFDDLSLPEITALASKAVLFVGNDSGIAHIAAAVKTPAVVIFGSSNREHWRPWTDAPNEIVFEPYPCQPCPGFECREFGEPMCIRSVTVEAVMDAVDRIISKTKQAAICDRLSY